MERGSGVDKDLNVAGSEGADLREDVSRGKKDCRQLRLEDRRRGRKRVGGLIEEGRSLINGKSRAHTMLGTRSVCIHVDLAGSFEL